MCIKFQKKSRIFIRLYEKTEIQLSYSFKLIQDREIDLCRERKKEGNFLVSHNSRKSIPNIC